MSTHRSLTSTQLQVLALIAAGSTARAAAEAAGVHRNTVSNWLCSDQFRQAMAVAQYEKALFLRDQAEALVAGAYDVIRAMLSDPAVPAGVRLKAALAIIGRADAPPPEPPPGPAAEIQEIVPNDAQFPKENPALRNEAKPCHAKIGRNELCPCGSGVKFKRCCLLKRVSPSPAT